MSLLDHPSINPAWASLPFGLPLSPQKLKNKSVQCRLSGKISDSTPVVGLTHVEFFNFVLALADGLSLSYITTDGQSASLSCYEAPIWGLWPDFYYCQTTAGLLIWGALSDERTVCRLQLLLSSPAQSFSGPHFTVSVLRLPQPGGPDPCIYIPQEQGGPVITPGTGYRIWFVLCLAYIPCLCVGEGVRR
jgi:hypothetical protein